MGAQQEDLPEWERLLAAERHLQHLVPGAILVETSRALWNRSGLDLDSDEVLAQVLDRGEMETWRVLYRLARTDARLRARLKRIVLTVPIAAATILVGRAGEPR